MPRWSTRIATSWKPPTPDAALDLAHRTEAHMTSDRPGLIMRRRLLELLKAHNDPEVTRNYVVAGRSFVVTRNCASCQGSAGPSGSA